MRSLIILALAFTATLGIGPDHEPGVIAVNGQLIEVAVGSEVLAVEGAVADGQEAALLSYLELASRFPPFTPPDPYWPLQYGAQSMWVTAHPADWSGEVIAVLDTGWDYTLADQPILVPGHDFIDFDDDPQSDELHGIHSISVIGAPHGRTGIAGVCPGCPIMPIRVCRFGRCPETAVTAGLNWAVSRGVKVISMGMGGHGDMPYLRYWVDRALERGVVIVAAAGNDGGETFFPAGWDGVVAIGSVDRGGLVPGWVNSGWDYLAPGDRVLGDCGWDYCRMTGTSVSTALAAGAFAANGRWRTVPTIGGQMVIVGLPLR